MEQGCIQNAYLNDINNQYETTMNAMNCRQTTNMWLYNIRKCVRKYICCLYMLSINICKKTYDVCFRQYVIFDTPHVDTDDTPGACRRQLDVSGLCPRNSQSPPRQRRRHQFECPGWVKPAGMGTWFLFSNFTNFQVPAVVNYRGSIATLPKWTFFWEIGECTCCRTSEISP